ncbi:hypothetical protein D3C84_1139810 [compost metagenome]
MLQPYRLDGPIVLEMQFKPGELLNRLQSRLTDCFDGPHRLILRGASVLEVWEQYLIAKTE